MTTSDDKEMAAWMKEHLVYETHMLRYTYCHINTPQTQLEWNAYYEAFAVHARNLYYFLANSGKPNEYKATHFVPGFSGGKTEETITPFVRLHEQVFHMGKKRPASGPRKFHLDNCRDVFAWIDEHLLQFVDELRDPFRTAWHEGIAPRPSEPPPLALAIDDWLSIPRACTGPTFLKTVITTSGSNRTN